MQVQAAMYRLDIFDFLSDGVTQADLDSLIGLLRNEGVTVEEDRPLASLRTWKILRDGKYKGSLDLSAEQGDRGISGSIKLDMIPYEGRLRNPQFLAVTLQDDGLTRRVLETYTQPVIITSGSEEVDASEEVTRFKTKFETPGRTYLVRPQSQREDMSITPERISPRLL